MPGISNVVISETTKIPTSVVGDKKVTGKQSNHGGYRLPTELVHLTDVPLYIAVAHWGLIKGTSITRDEISQVFHITARRAADVMTYIHVAKAQTITSVKRVTRVPGERRNLRLKITAIAHDA